MRKNISGRTIYEICLLTISLTAITLSFFLQSGDKNVLSLVASLCGTVGVLFVAKGMIAGQYIILAYSVLYAVLSFLNAYYGECILSAITMLPSSLTAIIVWTRNPSADRGKVKINRLHAKEYGFMLLGIAVITVGVYFILRALHTAQLVVSTISFITSLGAAYLLIRRSRFYAVFYILNDVVLIVLWSLALAAGEKVLPSVISFCVFLLNDSYGFYDWCRRARLQRAAEAEALHPVPNASADE